MYVTNERIVVHSCCVVSGKSTMIPIKIDIKMFDIDIISLLGERRYRSCNQLRRDRQRTNGSGPPPDIRGRPKAEDLASKKYEDERWPGCGASIISFLVDPTAS